MHSWQALAVLWKSRGRAQWLGESPSQGLVAPRMGRNPSAHGGPEWPLKEAAINLSPEPVHLHGEPMESCLWHWDLWSVGLCHDSGFTQGFVYLSLPLKFIVFISGSLVINLGRWGSGDCPYSLYVGSHRFLYVAFPWISTMLEGAGSVGSCPAWCFSCTRFSNSCVATEVFICGLFSLEEGDLLVWVARWPSHCAGVM